MKKPHIAATRPVVIEVEAGKTYWWCACGRSQSQPFCDGSHNGTEFTPLEWLAEKNGPVAFCCCKQTGKPPLCDGNHKRITTQPR